MPKISPASCLVRDAGRASYDYSAAATSREEFVARQRDRTRFMTSWVGQQGADASVVAEAVAMIERSAEKHGQWAERSLDSVQRIGDDWMGVHRGKIVRMSPSMFVADDPRQWALDKKLNDPRYYNNLELRCNGAPAVYIDPAFSRVVSAVYDFGIIRSLLEAGRSDIALDMTRKAAARLAEVLAVEVDEDEADRLDLPLDPDPRVRLVPWFLCNPNDLMKILELQYGITFDLPDEPQDDGK